MASSLDAAPIDAAPAPAIAPDTTTARPAAPILLAQNLVKTYVAAWGTTMAVRGLNLEVAPGQCFGVLGPNGAGKTSLMKMVYGALPPTSGALRVLGLDPVRQGRRLKARLGVMPQDATLDDALTVRENLMLFARYFRIPTKEASARADRLLAFTQLSEKREANVEHELSGGMKRRLLLARALINGPDLLILDEPTTGMDPQARRLVWDRLLQLKEQGVSIIVTTHYMEEASQLCDRLVIMDQGQIVADGPPAGLIAEHVSPEVLEVRLPAGERELAMAALDGLLAGHQEAGDRLYLYTDDGERALHHLRDAGISPDYALSRRATLEDVFLRLTGHTLE